MINNLHTTILERLRMDLSPVKNDIIEALLLHEKPVKAAIVAKEIGKAQNAVQMHLIGLVRMGYAESPQKGYYIISVNGKETLGIPEVSKEKALSILRQTSLEKAFHFYEGIGKPLNLHASDLSEFCDKISKLNVKSIEFHMNRGNFEAWFKSLGDRELEKKMALLKMRGFRGEELHKKVCEMAEKRCMSLSQKVAAPA
ncbi:MAG: hypothetical protein NWF00_06765 [Candidatus Bathyarchaeota archaeon]|nr:hypothetical protein [Candidatus Bathyarchaeota archaeon]